MIIEAGYDVALLADGAVNRSGRSKHGLWAITFDEHLRLVSTDRVVARMELPLPAYIDEISAALRRSPAPVRYLVLAYRSSSARLATISLGSSDERLTADGWLGDVELLGQVVFDSTGCVSTVPRYRFQDYIGLEHLPRAVSVLGPHDVGCECVACVHFEQLLLESRRDAAAGGS